MKSRQIFDSASGATRSSFSHCRVHGTPSEEGQLPPYGANGLEDTKLTPAGDNRSYQLVGGARIHVLEILFRRLYLSVACVFCMGTVAAMGSGSGGGSTESNPLRQEVGSSAFKVYNQLVISTPGVESPAS